MTDLVENIGPEHVSRWGRLVCRVFGIYRKPAPAPEHSWFALDPEAVEASLDEVRGWDFDKIVMAHGERIERDGRAVFDRVADGLLRRSRRRGPVRRLLLTGLAHCI